jgi:hypothetical protein
MRSGQPILVTDNEDNKPSITMHNSKLTHLLALMDEVTYLKRQIEPSGCGHIYTTINTLTHRIKRIKKRIEQENEDYC